METSAVSLIKECEDKAHKIIDDAKANAENMIAETEKSSREFLEKTVNDISAENEKRLNDVKEKSKSIVENNRTVFRKEAEEYEENARQRLMGAVKIILKEITEQCQ